MGILLHTLLLPFTFFLLAFADVGHDPFSALKCDPALNRRMTFPTINESIFAEILLWPRFFLNLNTIQKTEHCIHKLSPSLYR